MKMSVPRSGGGSVTHCRWFVSKFIAIIIIVAAVSGILLMSHPGVENCANEMTNHPLPNSYKKDGPTIIHERSAHTKRFPDAVIFGVRKGGTKALIDFLSIHPGIAAQIEEVHYFDWNYKRGLKWYLRQMVKSYPGQITMEKSPNYFVDPYTPKRLYIFKPFIKLMLILVNPVDRVISDYTHHKAVGREQEMRLPFEKVVIDQKTGEVNKSQDIIQHSMYIVYIEKWLAYFKLSQIHFLDGDVLKHRPWEELYRAEQFLNLHHELGQRNFVYNTTKGFYCIKKTKPIVTEVCLENNKGRPHPDVDPDVRRKLEDFYRPYNKQFFEKIGRQFDWP